MLRSLNVATPPTAARVSVPDSTPPGPALVRIATVTFAVDAVKFPPRSSIDTCTLPALIGCVDVVVVGFVVNTSFDAGPTFTLKALLAGDVNTPDVATSV